MNKRIKKKIIKRGYFNTYKEYKKGDYIKLPVDMVTCCSFSGIEIRERKIMKLPIQNLTGTNKNRRTYSPEVVIKAFEEFSLKNPNIKIEYKEEK